MVQNIARLVILKIPGVAEPSAPNGRIHARSLKRLVHTLAAIHLANNLVKEILRQNRLIARHVTFSSRRSNSSQAISHNLSKPISRQHTPRRSLRNVARRRIFALLHVGMLFRLLLKIACKHKASKRSYCQQWKRSRVSPMLALPLERA